MEENIQQLEEELRDHVATPLMVHEGSESTVPQLFVPEITIPVSLTAVPFKHTDCPSIMQHLGLELLPPSPVKPHPPKTPDGKVQKASELGLLASNGELLRCICKAT